VRQAVPPGPRAVPRDRRVARLALAVARWVHPVLLSAPVAVLLARRVVPPVLQAAQ